TSSVIMSNRSGAEVFVSTVVIVSDDDFFFFGYFAMAGGRGVEVGQFSSSSAGDNNSL
ncbi:unnamed protein product, partial [Rotaria sordida]